MPDRKPTPAQAQLHLQIYDLRREAKLREARDWMMQNFFVDSLDDYARVCPPGSREGTWAMMVVSYWDQACALLNYGLLHESLFFETSGEFFAVWERIKPVVAPMRERFHINFWASNLEKAAGRFEKWVERKSPGALASMREFTVRMRAAKTQKGADAKASAGE